jgi:hypothetical protein
MSRLFRRGKRKPQIIWGDDYRLRVIGQQLEAEAGANGGLGPVFSDAYSLREIFGNVGAEGGRVFLTEGIWFLHGSMTINTKNLHIYSTSPGRTILRRASTGSTAESMLIFKGEGVTVEGIRFIDNMASARAVIELDGQRSTVRDCVFEDVSNGVKVESADWCAVRDCRFTSVTTNAVEYSGTCEGGMVTGNIVETNGGDIYLGDNVSGTVVTGNSIDAGSRKISYFTGRNISTGSLLNAIGPEKVEERS